MTDISREFHQEMASLTTTISLLLSRLKPVDKDEHHLIRDDVFKKIPQNPSSSSNEVGEIDAESEMLEYKMSQQERKRRISIGEITAAIEMLDISMPEEHELRASVADRIIHSLSYTAMTNRYEDVVEAHPQTFEWAFHDPTEDQLPWSNFSEWLRAGRGVYWVSGKAGSGKSTFMKHIFDSGRTREYLEAWAEDIPLCVASFFFWNSGSTEQKSQVGCLRALLFQFSQSPLIWFPRCCPSYSQNCTLKLYDKAVSTTVIPILGL